MKKWMAVIFITVVVLITALFAIQFVTPKEQQIQGSKEASNDLIKVIVDQIFPDSHYKVEDGMINFSTQIQAVYQTYYLEQIQYGRFIDSTDEYIVILRAPKEVTFHAGGFYNVVVAVFDSRTNKIKSPVQYFSADEGEISIIEGQKKDYLLFLGSTMYQGWAETQGALYDISSGKWERVWPANDEFWKDRYAVYGNNRLVLYKRVIEPHNQESAIPPNHFEPVSELIWDQGMEVFREPAMQ